MFKGNTNSHKNERSMITVIAGILAGLVFNVGMVEPADCATYDRRTPVVEAVDKALPAVVNISTTKVINVNRLRLPHYFRTPLDDLFSEKYQIEGLGSGVVVGGQYIVTNYHVVAYDDYKRGPSGARTLVPADEILISFNDEKEQREAFLVGADPSADVAILKIIGEPHEKHLPWGRSDDLMIGETVIAIGSALGQPFTVTTGIISALNRSIEDDNQNRLNNLIQTNADINQGNSGGPLININGEFIGLNTAIISPTGGSVGLGLAIPVSRVKKTYDYWVNHILSLEDQMGIEIQDMNPSLKRYFRKYYDGLRDHSLNGAVVLTVSPHGISADRIQRQDVITSVDGRDIGDCKDFLARLEEHKGRSVKLGVVREGKSMDIELPSPNRKVEVVTWQGMEIQELDNPWRRWFNLTGEYTGLVILDVAQGSIAAQRGIQRGDVLYRANETELSTLSDLKESKKALERSSVIQLETIRLDERQWKRRRVRLVNQSSL